jgi:hypothetical protein
MYEVTSKTNCIQSMAPQGAEGEDSEEAREAHLELLLFSYLSPATAALLVIFFSTGPSYYPLQFSSRLLSFLVDKTTLNLFLRVV